MFTVYSSKYTKYFENFEKNIPSSIKLNSCKTNNFDTRRSNEKWLKCLEYLKEHANEYILLCDTTSLVNKNFNFDMLSDIEQCDVMLMKGYHSERSKFNLGCMVVKSNDNVIRLFEKIADIIEQKKQWDQDVVDDLLYYNKSNDITWRYIPDKFALIVSDKEDSVAAIPKNIPFYKFIRRTKLETYNALLKHLTRG